MNPFHPFISNSFLAHTYTLKYMDQEGIMYYEYPPYEVAVKRVSGLYNPQSETIGNVPNPNLCRPSSSDSDEQHSSVSHGSMTVTPLNSALII